MKDGYLLLHGKGAGPEYPGCAMTPVAERMQAEGKLYDHRANSWALGSVFYKPYESCLEEIAAGIQRLTKRGATRIHLVGHSIGANMLFYYATKFSNFKSIVSLSPAHNTHLEKFNQWSLWSRRKAEALLAEGRDEPDNFIDTSMMETYIIKCLPSAYLSYLSPQGNSVMTKNVRRISQPINLFLASGTNDFTQVEVERLLYSPAPKLPSSQLLQTADGHILITTNTYEKWTHWCENLPT
jgi:pimeloyl-ACP methyl ester carboxylesterase